MFFEVSLAPSRAGFTLLVTLGLGLCVAPALAQSPSLTLQQALALGEQNSAAIRDAQAEVRAVEAQFAEAKAFLWNNPELFGEIDRRNFGDNSGSANEWALGLNQKFELAGQPKHRRAAAQQELSAAQQSLLETRLQVRADVTQRWVRVAALQTRVETERELLKLVEDLAAITGKRIKAGEIARLEGNLAAVEADRARNQLSALSEQLIESQRELSVALQLPAESRPIAAGEISGIGAGYTLEQLRALAADRPLLKALRDRESAARSRLALEKAAAYPDVTVGVGAAREASDPSLTRDRVLGLTVSVPLPLFKRNQAAIGRAAADLAQAQVGREVTTRDVRAGIESLWLRLQSAQQRAQLLKESTLPLLLENQRLARRSFEVGRIGIAEVLLATRQAIEGRRETVEAEAEFALTRAQLEQVAGWNPADSPRASGERK